VTLASLSRTLVGIRFHSSNCTNRSRVRPLQARDLFGDGELDELVERDSILRRECFRSRSSRVRQAQCKRLGQVFHEEFHSYANSHFELAARSDLLTAPTRALRTREQEVSRECVSYDSHP
jgi:hypothetical protein